MNKKALDPVVAFELECAESISRYQSDKTWQTMSGQWVRRAFEQKYMFAMVQNPPAYMPFTSDAKWKGGLPRSIRSGG